MTDRTRRELAARYMNGNMTPDERVGFEALMGKDERLRLFTQAERIIETAFELGTTAAVPALEHSATRSVVMEHLARATHSAGQAARLSLTTKIIVVSALGLGTMTGTYFTLRGPGEEQRVVPAYMNAPASSEHAIHMPEDTIAASEAPVEREVDTIGPARNSEGREPRDLPEPTRNATSHREGRATPQPATPVAATPSAPKTASPVIPASPSAQLPVRRTAPSVTRDSSVNFKVIVPKGGDTPR